MKNELQLIDQMLNRRSETVSSRHQVTTCTKSKQISRRESDSLPEVCGFPVYNNPFNQLSVFESHTKGQLSEIPIVEEVEESEDKVILLTDPRKKRAQKVQSDCSKSLNPVAEPIISVQNTEDSEISLSMQYMTEQATGFQNSVQDQKEIQISDQSVQRMSSTEQSVQSSIQLAHTGAFSSTQSGVILQETIPLPRPTVELKPCSPPTFHGRFREDVSRWLSYMGNYLTFMQGTPD